MHAHRDGDKIVVEIQDRGIWRPAQDSGRGRGLKLMRSLMDEVTIETNEKGTLVRLTMPLTEYVNDRSSNVSVSRV